MTRSNSRNVITTQVYEEGIDVKVCLITIQAIEGVVTEIKRCMRQKQSTRGEIYITSVVVYVASFLYGIMVDYYSTLPNPT